jgi:hypothetical protein
MRPEQNIARPAAAGTRAASGEFVDLGDGRYYVIRNVDHMPPFLVSVISSADHWLFVSSSGGLTAGRVSPESTLFPYITVDKLHDAALHTGCRTILQVGGAGQQRVWEPFNREHDGRYATSRNLYKSVLGEKLRFEEINHDLGLAFRYTWATSDRHGFVRDCEIENLRSDPVQLELVDGLQNILPAGTPGVVQASASNLVNAYKWTELDRGSRLALYTLYAGISDRAEPCESLRANVVYGLGLEHATVLLSSLQLDDFRHGAALAPEHHKRGIRGSYFLGARLELTHGGVQRWKIVADVERTQAQVVDLIRSLADPGALRAEVEASVAAGRDDLARIVAAADGFQAAGQEAVTAHHYANALFNVLRGGVFADQYRVSAADFARSVRHFNRRVHERHNGLLASLDATLPRQELVATARRAGDPQLERLCLEYLPITFGRRHGDPSRPWNRFSIRVRDESGQRSLFYEGNWRDIFQNWEALALSFPEFAEGIVAKFVNASTVDGYNPYRITKEGIDWEVEHPGDPWSHIGYWGDHQIIYLLKLLEASRQFHPSRLSGLLHRPVFSYANVPYRLRSFAAVVRDPKRTVDYDHALAARIAERVAAIGADGKLVLDADGNVYLVNLLEKLLVPLLAKLGNLVLDGGIWLNTQRPEWNDANNALVGHGISVVTLCYMRRHLRFMQELLAAEQGTVELSAEVSAWLSDIASALADIRPWLDRGPVSASQRWQALEKLGAAASRYHQSVYADTPFTGKVAHPLAQIHEFLGAALAAIDHSIRSNRREDGMYHAYNVLDLGAGEARVDRLYLMLEGQVAVLSSGALGPSETVALVESLFSSDLYRADQRSFMLYPDRQLPGFLEKNRIPETGVRSIPLLRQMLEAGDGRIASRDAEGCCRFNADLTSVRDLEARIDSLAESYGEAVEAARDPLRELYEAVFRHREFTGRSGTMFGFEGLGCIYWHMVSKLLLAIQENFRAAQQGGTPDPACQRLGALYYQVRDGLGFNKTPDEYGAFPTDPYSHTPRHGGARQPGMTGQVKEEVLSRFGELGLTIQDGAVRFEPKLLSEREFCADARLFRFLDVAGQWQQLQVPARGLAFTWCQVPVVYRLADRGPPAMTVTCEDGSSQTLAVLSLPAELGAEIFRRSGRIRCLLLDLPRDLLLRSDSAGRDD